MARLTASDMISMVRDNSGGETEETLSDTRILRFINQSYLELCSKYAFDQLSTSTTVTTSSGTAAYEMSVGNVGRIIHVIDDTNNAPLEPISLYQYHSYVSGQASSITGTPVFYLISGVGATYGYYQLTFYPTPGGTYTIYVYYTKNPTELVASPTATSAVTPEAFDDVIIGKATARALRMLGNMDSAYKWDLTTREIEKSASKFIYTVSMTPSVPGSIIGAALG